MTGPEDGFADLERLLAARSGQQPSGGFRSRVLEACRIESVAAASSPGRAGRWATAAAAAAFVFLWFNITLASARNSDLLGPWDGVAPVPILVLANRNCDKTDPAVLDPLIRCGLAIRLAPADERRPR